ncbi:MAG: ABC transporter ATP-binding protein [Burkholderiaceae bacterium]|jgi:putative ABC transport system ATP-binding protein|nr:ABC transporter ATP-binding protein [Burkholderiaceae bacterium]
MNSVATPAVELRAVSRSYLLGKSTVQALREASMKVMPGEMVGLTGPSGSGKSTLLNIAGLIDRPDAGARLINGQAADRQHERDLTRWRCEQIGFVFQGFHLVPVMTVEQNVDYPLFLLGVPRGERRARVARQLEVVGLAAHARHRPDELSGGQRQRVAIARALIKQPRLVIADEPTASLDSATAAHVLDLMRQQCHEHGAALLMATHDERAVSRCDRVVAIRDGEIQ